MIRQFSRRLMEGVEDAPTAPQPQQQEPQDGPPAGERWPGYNDMRKTINDLRKQVNVFEAERTKASEDAKNAEEQARQKKLADEGNFETAMAEKQAAYDNLVKSHAAEVRTLKLEAKLAGMDELAMRGAIAACPEDANIEEYVADIRKRHAHLFEQAPRAAAPGGRSSSGSSQKSLRERLAAGDQDAMKDVFSKTMAGKAVKLD